MKRPSFQFYPADWRNNSNLGRCSPAARGIWMDVLCVLHDSDEYGIVRWPLAELANAVKAPLRFLRELVDKSVLKGCDVGPVDAFVYVPRSGRRDGDPVTLIPMQPGPIWFSSRMVRDEYKRLHAGAATRFGADQGDGDDTPAHSPSHSPHPSPRRSPSRRHGANQGDGSSSSSSSSVKTLTSANAEVVASKPATVLPNCPSDRIIDAYEEALPTLPAVRRELWDGAPANALRARWRWVLTAKKRTGERYATTADEAVEWFRRYFAYAARSDFLTGRSGKWTGCDLAWLVKAENFRKVLQGNYDAEKAA